MTTTLEQTALARIETITPVELFKPGTLDPILDAIKAEVRREAAQLDISTLENRKALASLAFKVARSKTFVDGQRLKLVADEKLRLKAIDKEGARIWDELEALQAEVRKPLTDWENAEKERVAGHEAALKELVDAGNICELNWNNPNAPVSLMHSRLDAIMKSTYDWQEFHQRAVATVTATIRQIKDAIAKREKYDAEQEELVRLRAEQAKRDQQEREEGIAREAKEQAEAEAALREKAIAKAEEAARQRIEDERNQAEARAKQAEAQRVQQEQQAAQQAKAAAEKAERDKALAVEGERQRQMNLKAAEDAAEAKREANKRHCAKINREVRDKLMQAVGQLLNVTAAEAVVKAIAADLIPYTKISY